MTEMIVVIPTHNRAELLGRTLRSLAECSRPERYRCTYVVENGGEFGAAEVAREADRSLNVQYRFVRPGNKCLALNSVLEEIDSALVVFFDDDIRFSSHVLVQYSNAAGDSTTGRFFGGPMGVDYEESPPAWLKTFLPQSAAGFHLDPPSGVAQGAAFRCDWFLGCNWSAFSSDLKACGGFDPAVGPGGYTGAAGQEGAMQMELVKHGSLGMYLPDATVWHYVPKDRCSPEWALNWAHRVGKSHGRRAGLVGRKCGLAGLLCRSCTQKLSILGIVSMLTGSRPGRHRSRHLRRYFSGLMEGYRLGKADRRLQHGNQGAPSPTTASQ